MPFDPCPAREDSLATRAGDSVSSSSSRSLPLPQLSESEPASSFTAVSSSRRSEDSSSLLDSGPYEPLASSSSSELLAPFGASVTS